MCGSACNRNRNPLPVNREIKSGRKNQRPYAWIFILFKEDTGLKKIADRRENNMHQILAVNFDRIFSVCARQKDEAGSIFERFV
jgi:hypothetical protein